MLLREPRCNRGSGAADLCVPGAAGLSVAGGRCGGAGCRGQDRHEECTILKVLGKNAEDIIESGDDVADAEMRQRFLSAYDAKHSIKAEGNKKATLILGADDFPFPIPLGEQQDWLGVRHGCGAYRNSVSSYRTQ